VTTKIWWFAVLQKFENKELLSLQDQPGNCFRLKSNPSPTLNNVKPRIQYMDQLPHQRIHCTGQVELILNNYLFFTEIKSTTWAVNFAANELMNRRNRGQFLAQGAADRPSHGHVGESSRRYQAGHLTNLYYSVASVANWAPDCKDHALATKHADFTCSAS
jgi:hypothetical protein